MSLVEGSRKEQELPHLGLSWAFPLQTLHFPIFPIFPLCFTLIFLSMKVSSLEICCSMRYAIEALVELLDLGVSHQGVHRYIMDHTSSLQSPVLQATKSKPHEYGGYLVDTWWIPGGFGNCTRSCLDTSGVLTFSCPSCQSSSDSHFFPDN